MDIYQSKLYLASDRKTKIRAAANNPINAELLEQLDEYISDEVREQYNPKPVEELPAQIETESTDREFSEDDVFHSDHDREASQIPPPRFSERLGDFPDMGSTSELSSPNDEFEDTMDDSQKPDDSTTNVHPELNSSTKLVDYSEIKTVLNASSATGGVDRTKCVNASKEVWVYYADRVNINSIMASTIDSLQASQYSNLEFNRIARSVNAMVFTYG